MNKFNLLFVIIFLNGCNNYKESKLIIYNDYNEGVDKAKLNQKNVFLAFDFYGNPTKSTTKLLNNKEIQRALNDYVIIHLFVDGMDVKSKKNAMLEIEKFGVKYQPCYFIVKYDESILKGPIGYSSIDLLKNFINK